MSLACLRWRFALILTTLLCVTCIARGRAPTVPSADETRQQAEKLLADSARQNKENHTLALNTARDSLALWQGLSDKNGQARAYGQIATCYFAHNDLAEAIESYQSALQLWRELNDRNQEAGTLIMLGFIDARRGEWAESITFLTQAHDMTSAGDDPTMLGQIANGLGYIFTESGLPEQGLIQYQQSLEFYRRTPEIDDDAFGMITVGTSQFSLGKYSDALSSLQAGLALAEPNSIDAALSREYQGRVYGALGDFAAAENHFRESLATYTRTVNPMEAARVRGLMGHLYRQEGKVALARESLTSVLQTYNQLSDKPNRGAIEFELGRLELSLGDYDAAESHLRQSIATTEDMRQVSTSRDLTVAFSATVHDRYEAFIDCLMRKQKAAPQSGFAVQAFETSELARGRSLAELLRAASVIAGLDPELAERETSLRQSLRVKQDARVSLLGTAYRKERLDEIDGEIGQLEDDYRRIEEEIRTRFPDHEVISNPASLTLKQIQERVLTDDQTILLEYSLGEERSYLWAVTHDQFSSYELPSRAEIEKAARRFHDLLAATQPVPGETFDQLQQRIRESEAQLPAAAESLGDLLLAPVAEILGSRRLIIVADGAVQYVPFQALVLSRKGEVKTNEERRPLMLDHEIVNEPSASVLGLVQAHAAQRRAAPNSVAVLADPVFDNEDSRVTGRAPVRANAATPEIIGRAFRDIDRSPDSKPLPRLLASREEANAIMTVVPWRTGLSATDFDASRATVTGSQLNDYRILHFATHAYLDDNDPEYSGIVLSRVDKQGRQQEGFLRMKDIYSLRLPVDLVVLSACNTGLGKDVKGEGLIGLTRGFMYAGAGGVVASLWKVDDDATAELMKRFYQGMFVRGLTPAASMREAQVSMWRERRWHAPRYWAAFVIQGQYNQREDVGLGPSQRVKPFLPATAVVVLGLLSGLLFWRWRRQRRGTS